MFTLGGELANMWLVGGWFLCWVWTLARGSTIISSPDWKASLYCTFVGEWGKGEVYTSNSQRSLFPRNLESELSRSFFGCFQLCSFWGSFSSSSSFWFFFWSKCCSFDLKVFLLILRLFSCQKQDSDITAQQEVSAQREVSADWRVSLLQPLHCSSASEEKASLRR